jgi:hypothetical protein
MSRLAARSMPSATPADGGWTTATAENVVERALAILDEERRTWSSRREVTGPDGGADRDL